MVKKWQVNLLLILSAFTLVGVGFSSWAIIGGLNEMTQEKNGSVVVDEVLNGIEIDKTEGRFEGKDIFDYFEDGFKDSDGNVISTASIVFYLKIDLEKCYQKFEKNFKVNTELKYVSDDLSSFDFIANTTRVIDTNIDTNAFTDPDSNNRSINIQDKGSDYHNLKYSTTYSFLDTYLDENIGVTLGTISFSIKYDFTLLATYSDFESQVYPYLINSKFIFKLNIEEVDG